MTVLYIVLGIVAYLIIAIFFGAWSYKLLDFDDIMAGVGMGIFWPLTAIIPIVYWGVNVLLKYMK